MMRLERDSLGEVEVPQEAYWGAQTARSLHHFPIGQDRMPLCVIHAYGLIKYVAAEVNKELDLIDGAKAKWICEAAQQVHQGELDAHFPLSVWQTGSGTQTNMNVNEVIAHRASMLGNLGAHGIHPNDDVNLSQSSNDTFPTAMHIATVLELHRQLFPALDRLIEALHRKGEAFYNIIKIGRTHLMDAVPIRLGSEFFAYEQQVIQNRERLIGALPELFELALGATAVGTGLLCPPTFAKRSIDKIAQMTGYPFVQAKNLFTAIAAHDPLVFLAGILATLACSLTKMATDLSWMGSGPRSGLSELFFSENEPGSSIMPGKINPTQCEALLMVAIQVKGAASTIQMAGARGNFELNVYKPLIIYNLIHSIDLLSDAINSFVSYFVEGLRANEVHMQRQVERSLMLVTVLRDSLGYERAAQVALKAYREDKTLKEAALELKVMTESEFDALVDPLKMVSV